MDAIRLTYADSSMRVRFRYYKPPFRGLPYAVKRAFLAVEAIYLCIAAYLFVVASVAIYDICLTVKYWQSLKQMEENPVGRWLMNLDYVHEGVMPNLTLFIILKSMGTVVVLATIATLVLRYSRIGHPVALGVSCFQLGLAAYLTYGANG